MRFLLLAAVLIAALPARARAQGSPYIPLDHPLLPLAEYLINRGDIEDPSPMIRPFRRSDLLRVITEAKLDTATASGRVARTLTRAFADRTDEDAWWRVAPRAGVQSFSWARRDLLRPAGSGGVRPYVDAAFEGRFGPLVLATRPAWENRLKLDPEWRGRDIQQTKSAAYRFIEGYISAQFKWARLFYGQMPRNWGPADVDGLGVAGYAYPRSDIGFDVMLHDLQINIVGTEISSMTDLSGAAVRRYFVAHRLNLRVKHNLNLAIWETGVLAGKNGSFDPYFRNPLVLMSFPLQFGLKDDRNTIIGGDLEWRPHRGLVIQAQAMIDDMWRRTPDPNGTGEPAHPGRNAFTLASAGRLGERAMWRGSFQLVSSLAYQTIKPEEGFTDNGLGIGPQFVDHYQAQFSVSVPVGNRWLVAPEAALLRQGQGTIDSPFPAGQAYADTPEVLIGTVETTTRFGIKATGAYRGVSLQGSTGVHFLRNADHVPGRGGHRFEARLLLAIGADLRGALR